MIENPEILVAMSENDSALTVAHFLESEGAHVERCADAAGVLRLTQRRDFAVVVLDLTLVDTGDMDIVTFVRRQSPDSQIILLFDIERIDRALEGIRRGAYFYLPRTSQPSDVAHAVNKALNDARTRSAAAEHERFLFEEFSGKSPAMRRVVELIHKVAPTDSTVLLLGESGVGKEVMANTIHRLSPRRDQPFVAINCAALPEEILESELFGHVKGAFTGAVGD
jgi:DNA-binding NtrC family response regulator